MLQCCLGPSAFDSSSLELQWGRSSKWLYSCLLKETPASSLASVTFNLLSFCLLGFYGHCSNLIQISFPLFLISPYFVFSSSFHFLISMVHKIWVTSTTSLFLMSLTNLPLVFPLHSTTQYYIYLTICLLYF